MVLPAARLKYLSTAHRWLQQRRFSTSLARIIPYFNFLNFEDHRVPSKLKRVNSIFIVSLSYSAFYKPGLNIIRIITGEVNFETVRYRKLRHLPAGITDGPRRP